MQRKYKVTDNFFADIDCEEKAYLLGFFLADGGYELGNNCTKSYKFRICLQEEDKEIVELFKEFIIPEKELYYKRSYIDKRNVNHKSTYSISWTSSKMAEDLKLFNIIPAKTYDVDFEFPFERIPDLYLWDFIRGFFDGDGQISFSDKTHQSTFALYGTSNKFMKKLGEIFEKEFNVLKRIEGIQKSNMILYTLRFSANGKRLDFFTKLYEKYYTNKKYFMKRKQEKFLKYLNFRYRDNFEYLERIQSIVERRE